VLNNGDKKQIEKYQGVFKDDASLALFLRNMRKFDQAFCQAMVEGTDFTLSFEVRGDKHKMEHCRVKTDRFDRPAGKKDGKG